MKFRIEWGSKYWLEGDIHSIYLVWNFVEKSLWAKDVKCTCVDTGVVWDKNDLSSEVIARINDNTFNIPLPPEVAAAVENTKRLFNETQKS